MTRQPLRVCAVTSSRADWSHLARPLALIRESAALELRVVVTGQHLTPDSGGSLELITQGGFEIAAQVDMQLADDTPVSATRSLGRAVIGFADVLERLKPDLLFVLGDRYELLAPVSAALLARVPVAHVSGGDITEGAVDESIRHAVTKMAHIHFVTNEDSALRVRQLGEDPAQVHVVGSPSLDLIRIFPPMDRRSFFQSIGLVPCERNVLTTFHPVTLQPDSEADCSAMLAALDELGPDVGLIFTGANRDVGGRGVDALIHAFAESRPNAVAHALLGSNRYFAALSHVDMVVGNSSSGLVEAPSFGVPTVNIGDRQRGRLRGPSVVDCSPSRASIRLAIDRAFELDCSGMANPYGDGHASERILKVLEAISEPERLLQKRFWGRG